MMFFRLTTLSTIVSAVAVAQAPAPSSPLTGAQVVPTFSTSPPPKLCQFAFCTANPAELATLDTKHDLSTTAKHNPSAMQAHASCPGNRTDPKRTHNMDLFCNFDGLAYSWTADAASCDPKAQCESFSIMSNWDLAKSNGSEKEPSQAVWGNLGVFQSAKTGVSAENTKTDKSASKSSQR